MTFDAALKRCVLIAPSNGTHREWDESTWAQRSTNNRPDAMNHGAMAFDSNRNRVLYLGGSTSTPLSPLVIASNGGDAVIGS